MPLRYLVLFQCFLRDLPWCLGDGFMFLEEEKSCSRGLIGALGGGRGRGGGDDLRCIRLLTAVVFKEHGRPCRLDVCMSL